MPTLIIITGHACTGKTTLGRQLAEKLNLPFIHRDTIKEIMFDALGVKDREWSKAVGKTSYAILYYLLGEITKNGQSVIVESNFQPAYDNRFFKSIEDKCAIVQILCKTNGPVLLERFKQRSESGQRHPGHVDHANYDEFTDRLLGPSEPLDVKGKLIEVDTTDFTKVDLDGIAAGLFKID